MRWKVKGGEEEGGLGTDRTRNEIDRRLPVVRVGRLATYQSRQVVDTLVPSSPSFSPRLPTFQSRTSTTTITRLPRTRVEGKKKCRCASSIQRDRAVRTEKKVERISPGNISKSRFIEGARGVFVKERYSFATSGSRTQYFESVIFSVIIIYI